MIEVCIPLRILRLWKPCKLDATQVSTGNRSQDIAAILDVLEQNFAMMRFQADRTRVQETYQIHKTPKIIEADGDDREEKMDEINGACKWIYSTTLKAREDIAQSEQARSHNSMAFAIITAS